MSLLRFLSAGRLDSEVLRRGAHAAVDVSDDALWALVSQSVVGRFGGGSVALVVRASATSAAVRQFRVAHRVWQALPTSAHLRLIGVTVTTAVLSHLVLTWSQSGLDAWRLILPVTGAMFGLVVSALSFVVPPSPRSTE